MSAIGDELRLSADDMERNPCVVQRFSPEFLRRLACRIDNTMVELPRGKDGKPIHVGDTVYGEDGRAWHVRGVTIGEKSIAHPEHVIRATGNAGELHYLKPEWLTHERPDSWKRIADELEEWSEDNRINGNSKVFSRAREIAERIRRLASKEGER